MEIELNHYIDKCVGILKDSSNISEPEIQLRQFLMSFNKLKKNLKDGTDIIRCFGCDTEMPNSQYISHLRSCERGKRISKKVAEVFSGFDELIVRVNKSSYKISPHTIERFLLVGRVLGEYLQGNDEFMNAALLDANYIAHFDVWTVHCPFCSQYYLKTNRKDHYGLCSQFHDSIKSIRIVGDRISYNSDRLIRIEDFKKEKLYEIKIKDENEFRRVSFFLENNISFPYDEAIKKL